MQWLKRIRGAIGMGFTWAILWAIAGVTLAVLWSIGAPLDGFFRVFDAPAPALGLAGFFAGASFSLVLAIAARHRKFEELSLLKFTLLGALGGLLLASPFLLLGDARAAEIGVWKVRLILMTPLVLLSALSAAGTLLIARRAERGAQSLGPGSVADFDHHVDSDRSPAGHRRDANDATRVSAAFAKDRDKKV